jgi:7-carboxy-7-deazaguanine synthase
MTYLVKEIFYTLQGEGTHTGRAAVFCRFTSCNLWTGREKDRFRAICQFCDTDFVGTDGPGGGRFATARDLALAVAAAWTDEAHTRARPFVVCTGGEPLLQLDVVAVEALHAAGFEVAVETNGTQDAPAGLDWICVSPKAGAPLKLFGGDELKLVYPQEGADPRSFEGLDFPRLLLQPMDGPEREKNTRLAVEYCMAHPQWTLSLQTHKYLGIP